ncbi:Holliday junction branch migration protein RuvA [candidate division WOR-3 bacterium 4484_100]|uniref:Holliday junction branch migration complex subunit RuvA n=1 Tax=candidate division WOR-3 bacterium 4484_100 TaxID=1936077 RepID=A0A1V4QFL8_UNCW3|nr:MAG: Holliday junction branch migration protein RuvA [candidate division WOR-3 bacterium 4484_100]
MIGRLRGKILEKSPPYFILDVSGIGFTIQSPLSLFNDIEPGQEVVFFTKCLIKEDQAFIYGFLDKTQLEMFETLLSVPGLGPKSGLNLLSNFSPDEIAQAIESENTELLSSVPKIGKKLASKIILELKGKLPFAEQTGVFAQAIQALCSLGLTRNEAIQRLKGLPKNLSLEQLVKQALRK